MLGIPLMAEYLSVFPGDYDIIFVGDEAQIPPIDEAPLLKPLLESKIVPVIQLTHNFRLKNQDLENNTLYHNISKIRKGETDLKQSDSFKVMPGDMPVLLKYLETLKPLGLTFQELVVITPYNKHVDMINKYVQHMYFPKAEEGKIDSKGCLWHVGDPIICKQNNRTFNIYNGSMGKICDIKDGKLYVDFIVHSEDKQSHIVPFNLSFDARNSTESNVKATTAKELDTSILRLAYALTIDSCQGSEWDFVVFYLPFEDESEFVTRERVYVAASRASFQLVVVGSPDFLTACIKRTQPDIPEYFSTRLRQSMAVKK